MSNSEALLLTADRMTYQAPAINKRDRPYHPTSAHDQPVSSTLEGAIAPQCYRSRSL